MGVILCPMFLLVLGVPGALGTWMLAESARAIGPRAIGIALATLVGAQAVIVVPPFVDAALAGSANGLDVIFWLAGASLIVTVLSPVALALAAASGDKAVGRALAGGMLLGASVTPLTWFSIGGALGEWLGIQWTY